VGTRVFGRSYSMSKPRRNPANGADAKKFKNKFRELVKDIDPFTGLDDEAILEIVTNVLEEFHR
jgi:hypothetical protein